MDRTPEEVEFEIGELRKRISTLAARIRKLSVREVRRSGSGRYSVYDTVQVRHPSWSRPKVRRAIAGLSREMMVGVRHETVAGGTKPTPCADDATLKDILDILEDLPEPEQSEIGSGRPIAGHPLFCLCRACGA